MTHRISRRQFIKNSGLAVGAATLVACAPQATATQAPAATSAPGATQPAATGPEPLTLPIVKDKLTLSYWVDMGGNAAATLKSFNEMTCYKEQEKITNIHLDFQHPPVGQAPEQFNLLVASGKYPDVIEYSWPSAPGGPSKYLKDGVIIKLNDLIDKYAPNLKKVLTDHPDWRRQILTDDGEIYCFPFLRGDTSLLVFQGPIIRQDWLDKIGMQRPTTIDEWHSVLMAFKEKDPGGTGTPSPWTPSLYALPLQAFSLPHAYIGAWGITYNFYQDNGVVKHGALQPEMKDFLTVMAQWYKDGLVDLDFPTMDQKLEDSKVTGNILGSFVQNTGGGIGKYLGLMKDKDPNFKVVAAVYPTLKAGEVAALGQRDFTFPGVGAAITTACKNVTETVKLLDFAYSEQGYNLFNFGVEGLTYNWVNGYPKYTDLIMNNPDKLPLAQSMAQHFRSNFSGPFVQAKEYFEQYAILPEQQESIKLWSEPKADKLMPPVTPTQDESKKFATIMNDAQVRMDEGMIKIITGQQPVSSWDSVVSDIKNIGIDDAVVIQQASLDRYNKRP